MGLVLRKANAKDQERRTVDTDNTQGGAEPSPASAGSVASEPLPYDPKDPYWLFKEASRFDAEFMRKVGQPLGAAMAEQVDRMWKDAIDKAERRS
jgi:hypothetical protein